MTNYIKIDSVLTRVPKYIRDNYDDLSILSEALVAYRTLEITQSYEHDVRQYTIQNHQVQLDNDIKLINNVYFMNGKCTKEDMESLCSITTTSEDVCNDASDCFCCKQAEGYDTRSTNICRHTINYQLFLDSAFMKNNYTPLKYIGNSVGITKDCAWKYVNEPYDTYSVDKNKLMRVACQKEGTICIDFDREVLSDDGDFMIPDNEKLKRALAMYATAMLSFNDMLMHKQGSSTLYSKLLQQAETLLKSAKGDLIQRNLNPNTVRNIIFSEQGLMRNPKAFSNKNRYE